MLILFYTYCKCFTARHRTHQFWMNVQCVYLKLSTLIKCEVDVKPYGCSTNVLHIIYSCGVINANNEACRLCCVRPFCQINSGLTIWCLFMLHIMHCLILYLFPFWSLVCIFLKKVVFFIHSNNRYGSCISCLEKMPRIIVTNKNNTFPIPPDLPICIGC